MKFEFKNPQAGQPLLEYVTSEYLTAINEAIRFILNGLNITGGPGILVKKQGDNFTISANNLSNIKSSGSSIPLTAKTLYSGGTATTENGITTVSDGTVGTEKWQDEFGNEFDLIDIPFYDENTCQQVATLRVLGAWFENTNTPTA